MTKIVCTSDWHGQTPTDLPPGDILVIGGDVCPVWDHDRRYQANWLKGHFRSFLEELAYEEIIFIAGNHDFILQESDRVERWFPGFHYLQDKALTIGGIKFYGTPWTPTFGNWAFMCDETMLDVIFSRVPLGVDVLISHGPPHGACDLTLNWGNEHVGSRALKRTIEQKGPRYVVCGHIHEGYGQDYIGETEVLNVSLMDLDYNPVNASVVIEL